MVQCRPAFSVANPYVCPGPFPLGNSVGAIGWPVGSSGGFGPGGFLGCGGRASACLPRLGNDPDYPLWGVGCD